MKVLFAAAISVVVHILVVFLFPAAQKPVHVPQPAISISFIGHMPETRAIFEKPPPAPGRPRFPMRDYPAAPGGELPDIEFNYGWEIPMPRLEELDLPEDEASELAESFFEEIISSYSRQTYRPGD